MSAFSLILGLGGSLAVWRVLQHVPGRQAVRWANAALLCLLAALIGARLAHVLIHGAYYKTHVLEIFAIWMGGLSWIGALPGAYAGVWLAHRSTQTGLLKSTDILSAMIAPLAVSVWLACWLGGYAWGWLAPEGAFWGVPALDESGLYRPHFPLQLIAAAGMLLFAFWLETRKFNWQHDGQKAAAVNLGLALHLLLFTPLRADPAPAWLNVRLDAWAALLFFITGAGFFYWQFFGQGSAQGATLAETPGKIQQNIG